MSITTNQSEPEAEIILPQYSVVSEWIEHWFVPRIRRRMNAQAGKGLSWDPQWWMYPEVVARMLALHGSWEEAMVAKSASAMSTWWISHLEPHLRVIYDSDTGPMSHAEPGSSFKGHPALPISQVPDDVRARYDDDGIAALAEVECLFPTVWDWVEGWFVKVVRRRITPTPGKGLSWDPAWWQYPEVVCRFIALHAGWEHARASKSATTMSTWWVSHLDGHLRVIFNGETGPMSLAGAGSTFSGHTQIRAEPPTDAVRNQLPSRPSRAS